MATARIRKPTEKERTAYKAITGAKKCFGRYHKCCFHLHTPASHDYTLFSDWNVEQYRESSEQEILDKCIERRVVIPTVTLDDILLENELSCFDDRKQLLSYLLLADSLISAEIEVILVADHNTIQGIDKLRVAIKWVNDTKKCKLFPIVMLGVEISCADRNHVVGMFKDTLDNRKAIKEWLEKYLIDVVDGVFVTSIDALELIKACGGIGYIAHINTSDLLKRDTFSGGFKKRLLNNKLLSFIGLSDISKKEQVENQLVQYRKEPVKYLLDNDAHDVDTVEYNCFWLKGGNCTFSMVLEALNDYNISVDFSLPTYAKQFIKGLYVERSEKGFLTGTGEDAFCITFSNALNCLIGGRGTGKSSVLGMLEYVINQRCSDERKLDFLCTHGTAWVVYELDGDDYLFEISMPRKEYPDSNVLDNFGGMKKVRGRYEYIYQPIDVTYYAATHYLHIRKIIWDGGEDWKIQEIAHPEKIRDRFLDTKYSINELVNTASSEEINQFIEKTILKNQSITDPTTVVSFRKKAGLQKMLDTLDESLIKRAECINTIIQPFNHRMRHELCIQYQQDGTMTLPDFERLIFGREAKKLAPYDWMNIREVDIIQYVSQLYVKLGAIDFFRMLLNKDFAKAQQILPLRRFLNKMTVKMIDAGIQSIEPDQEDNLLSRIFGLIVADKNMPYIKEFLRSS